VWWYILKDHLGSTRAVYGTGGTIQTYYDYDPYGKIIRSTQNEDPKYRFTGQELDDETGLHNFRARNYDSDGGFLLATDPARQSWSRYNYCLNNPVSLVDPSGRWGDPKYLVNGMDWGQQGKDMYYDNIVDLKFNAITHLGQWLNDVREGKTKPFENGYEMENTLKYPSGHREGDNNLDPNQSGYSEGIWIVDGIHTWNWTEWSMFPVSALYVDLTQSYYDRALTYEGTPYAYGKIDPNGKGIDCSALICLSTYNKDHIWTTKSNTPPPGDWNKVEAHTTSYENFLISLRKEDLFVWPNRHAAYYAGGESMYHSHGKEGTPTGYTNDLVSWWLPKRGYPNVYRQNGR
jgi:RHS repeat-associated protein